MPLAKRVFAHTMLLSTGTITNGAIFRYNAAAQEVVDALGIPTIDMYGFVLKKCGGDPHYKACPGFQLSGNVHFTDDGFSEMAQFQWDAIKNVSTLL